MKLTDKNKQRLKGVLIILAIAAVSALIMIFAGEPIINWVKNPEDFRAWVNTHGLWGRVAFVGMVVLQIVIAFIPGEPLEIAAGYAFGAWEGTLLCVIATAIGGSLVFWFVRTLGIRIVEFFFPREKIDELKFLQNEKKVELITLILFLLPGTPKDLLTYAVGLTHISFGKWFLITTFARIPSIITSTIGGDALEGQNYLFAAIVFGVTLLISGIGILIYRRMNR